uniref:Uncharacterized protein n=1 Tax=Haptolina ericina TaxID=156174 RepID=A0A7S3B5E4_9EUKA|mmetsp:Transcript_48708/g.109661  ORF Transcript_48708/g.109661 Transcript_48708/m.109661 type:complete len:119 (+) Transcript_48708:172-528(+)
MELACSPFELGCSEYSIVSEGYAAWPLHARVYGTCTPSGQRLEKSTPHGLAVKKSAPTKEEHAAASEAAATAEGEHLGRVQNVASPFQRQALGSTGGDGSRRMAWRLVHLLCQWSLST